MGTCFFFFILPSPLCFEVIGTSAIPTKKFPPANSRIKMSQRTSVPPSPRPPPLPPLSLILGRVPHESGLARNFFLKSSVRQYIHSAKSQYKGLLRIGIKNHLKKKHTLQSNHHTEVEYWYHKKIHINKRKKVKE